VASASACCGLDQPGVQVSPVHDEHGGCGQAHQVGQADGDRDPDRLRHRAVGQNAEPLNSVHAQLGRAERGKCPSPRVMTDEMLTLVITV
jgi:hypothetical protein